MRWVLGVLLLVCLTACAGPEQQIQDAGAQAAREAAAEVGTARLAVQQLGDGKLWAQPAGQLVKDSEKALDGIVSGFDSQQPETDEARKLYDRISQLLDDAAQAVTDTRIALGNGDEAAAAQQVAALEKSAQQLLELAG
ncbi:hypothetical protein [Kribbella sp. NPDC051770]|uniref:hypothetical protein n=1 Tax=Kribbella sp. NPDC051770 TaxID=3155413 RepID=UPI00343314CD